MRPSDAPSWSLKDWLTLPRPMISAFTNTFKIPELRNRVLFTLVMLVVVRVGAAITCPGVNASVIQAWFASQVNNQAGGSVAALFNIFSGGALENCARLFARA